MDTDMVKRITGLKYNATIYHINDGFFYISKIRQHTRLYLKCATHKNCPASASMPMLISDRTVSNFRLTSSHRHPPQPEWLEVNLLRTKIMRRCGIEDKSVRKIYKEEVTGVPPKVADLLPYKSIRSAMGRARRIGTGFLPDSLRGYGEVLDVHPRLGRKMRDGNFYRATLEGDSAVALVFASPTFLAQLTNETNHIHIDASFKVVQQNPPYYWLLTIFLFLYDSAFPLVNVVMEKKSEILYCLAFSYMVENLFGGWQPKLITTDYEGLLQSAIRKTWNNAIIVGSWYHSANSMNKKSQRLELTKLMRENPSALRVFKMCQALPLLPPSVIVAGYKHIQQYAQEHGIQDLFEPFLSYIHNAWITGVGVQTFSVYKQKLRTSYDMESYHSKLLSEMTPSHANVLIFTDALKCLEVKGVNKLISLRRKQSEISSIPAYYILLNPHINYLTLSLDNNISTAGDFLETASLQLDNLNNELYNISAYTDEDEDIMQNLVPSSLPPDPPDMAIESLHQVRRARTDNQEEAEIQGQDRAGLVNSNTDVHQQILYVSQQNLESLQYPNGNQAETSGEVCKETSGNKEITAEPEENQYATCCALSCSNTSKTIAVAILPIDSQLRNQWLHNINRPGWIPSDNSGICQIHFAPDLWEEDEEGRKFLKLHAVPTLYLHGETIRNDILISNDVIEANEEMEVENEESSDAGADTNQDHYESLEIVEQAVNTKKEALELDMEMKVENDESPDAGTCAENHLRPIFVDINQIGKDLKPAMATSVQCNEAETINPEIGPAPKRLKSEMKEVVNQEVACADSEVITEDHLEPIGGWRCSFQGCQRVFRNKNKMELHLKRKHSLEDLTKNGNEEVSGSAKEKRQPSGNILMPIVSNNEAGTANWCQPAPMPNNTLTGEGAANTQYLVMIRTQPTVTGEVMMGLKPNPQGLLPHLNPPSSFTSTTNLISPFFLQNQLTMEQSTSQSAVDILQTTIGSKNPQHRLPLPHPNFSSSFPLTNASLSPQISPPFIQNNLVAQQSMLQPAVESLENFTTGLPQSRLFPYPSLASSISLTNTSLSPQITPVCPQNKITTKQSMAQPAVDSLETLTMGLKPPLRRLLPYPSPASSCPVTTTSLSSQITPTHHANTVAIEQAAPQPEVDSSDTFTITLSQFNESTRIKIKKKVLSLLSAIEKQNIDPDILTLVTLNNQKKNKP